MQFEIYLLPPKGIGKAISEMAVLIGTVWRRWSGPACNVSWDGRHEHRLVLVEDDLA